MINKTYADFAWEQAAAILAVDSPTGFTANAARWAKDAFEALGYAASITTKGGVLVDLGGEDASDALMLAAHADTLGAMVAEVKGSGCLRLTPLGGMRPEKLGVLSSEYHLFRASLFAKACNVEFVGIPARTSRLSQMINHFMREVAGVWHYPILGGQYD